MSDQKLRDLERRWKETGTVEDEAAYLGERVRSGDHAVRRVVGLAAYCGNVPAALALGRDPVMPRATRQFARGLERWGSDVVIFAAATGLRSAVAQVATPLPIVTEILSAIEMWCRKPNREIEERCARLDYSANETVHEDYALIDKRLASAASLLASAVSRRLRVGTELFATADASYSLQAIFKCEGILDLDLVLKDVCTEVIDRARSSVFPQQDGAAHS